MIDPFMTDQERGKLMIKRFAHARAAIITVVALACGVVHMRKGTPFDLATAYLYAILAIALIESFVVAVIVAGSYNPTIQFSFLLLCADLALITAIVTMTGASMSVFAFLYIIAILSASILLSFNWTIVIAAICSALFAVVTALETEGYVTAASAFNWPEQEMALGDVLAYSSMKIFAFFLTAFLAGCLSRRVGLLQMFQQNLLDSLVSGFITVNNDGRVSFINRAASNLLHRWSDSVGKHISAVFPVTDAYINPVEEALTRQKEFQGREIDVIRGDGKVIPVGVTVSPIRNGTDRLMGAIASFVDLTEYKKMEERLRRSDRLAAVGEMTAALAHEIRNPAASIRGSVQELSENLTVEGTNDQLLRIAVKECDKLNAIMSDFLEFVGNRPPVREEFDLDQLLAEVIRVAEQRSSKDNITFLKDWAATVTRLSGDRGQIKEAILNVILNSVETTKAGGCVKIQADTPPDSPDQISIRIQTEGERLSDADTRRLFDPFYMARQPGGGLGMAIAHRIVASHGGSIDVESVQGRGTTVTITLPIED
ncbi:MAG: ATP-binding protein [Candidatus Abyssubacteria bacterium]